jgi:hypothetical protein
MLAYVFQSAIKNHQSAINILPMPDLDLPFRQAPDALMLTGFWYRALPADRVHRHQLYKATLLEIPLVIGRDRLGHPFALRDACPIAACRSTAAVSTERISNAATTAGSSMSTMASVNSSPLSPPIRV